MSCIFCRIAAGEIPSEKIAENAHAFAFLDINPLVRGHALVIPKAHAERFADMSAVSAHGVMELVQHVSRQQTKGLHVAGATIAANDGKAAGQEVMHVHIHVVPRDANDGHGPIHALFGGHATLAPGELKEIGAKLRG